MKQIKLPAFCLSVFSGNTQMLSHEEYGIYVRLLECMWQFAGKLPNDDTKIAQVLHMSQKNWQKSKKVLQNFFTFSSCSFTHATLKFEYGRMLAKSRTNSLNARKKWARVGLEASEDHTKNTLTKTFGSWKSLDAAALISHIEPQSIVRASKLDIYKNKIIDDDGKLSKTPPESDAFQSLRAKVVALFEKHKVLMPRDEVYFLSRWLEQNIITDKICSSMEKILKRICDQGLNHPKSFAYFSKEIERLTWSR